MTFILFYFLFFLSFFFEGGGEGRPLVLGEMRRAWRSGAGWCVCHVLLVGDGVVWCGVYDSVSW